MNQEIREYKLREWAKIITAANSSEMSRKDWLEANNITKDAYYYWQKKVQEWLLGKEKNNEPVILSDEQESAMVEIPVAPCAPVGTSHAPEACAVLYLGNLKIELNNNASSQFMDSLGRMIHNAL